MGSWARRQNGWLWGWLCAAVLTAGCQVEAPTRADLGVTPARDGGCASVGALALVGDALCFCGNDYRWRCASLDDAPAGDMGPAGD